MAESTNTSAQEFLQYKGRPLVRSGKVLYYGNLYDDYVVMMQIVDTVKNGEDDFAGKIIVLALFTMMFLPAMVCYYALLLLIVIAAIIVMGFCKIFRRK